ncbi:6-aminohexanoate-cyclic-dimer hydrolase domain protein [Mycobacterium kansasii]|uniref:6-aminohexanoate-cyclic-dimer hydrolase domain protein n=1 Tax=Mycobacterium kansasii TaxID=1768 RepID=A0A1V3WTE4_MYCKA|nr:6-aminohexanoate-cyclic-dimer hydrolase domain protein [Mycobacterium kansasii]
MCELARSAGVLAPMQALENINNYIQSLTTFHESYDYFLTRPLPRHPLRSARRRRHPACRRWPGC